MSEATLKACVLHMYAQFDVDDRAAAVATAYERRVLEPGTGGGHP